MNRRADNAVLVRRYRVLLRAYPADYRAERGDELLGVLLDTAADRGRTRPSPADAVDVVRAGLARRWHQRGVAGGRSDWGEGAAVMAILLTAVLAMRSAGYGFDAIRWLWLYPTGSGPDEWYTWDNFVALTYDRTGWPVSVGWILVGPALVLGWRRTAAVLALLATAVDLIAVSAGTFLQDGPGVTAAPWLLIETAVALVLAGPPRSAAGLAVLGRRALAGVLAGCVAASWLRTGAWGPSAWNWLPVGSVLAVLAVRRRWLFGTPAGRRSVAVGAALASVYAASVGLYRLGFPAGWLSGHPVAGVIAPAAILGATATCLRLWPSCRRQLVARLVDAPE